MCCLIYIIIHERKGRSNRKRGAYPFINVDSGYNNPEYLFRKSMRLAPRRPASSTRDYFIFILFHPRKRFLGFRMKWVKDHRYVEFWQFCHFALSHPAKFHLCTSPPRSMNHISTNFPFKFMVRRYL